VYSKLFLLQLGSEAVCQKKPDVLRNWANLTKLSSAPQFNSLGVRFLIFIVLLFRDLFFFL